MKYPPLKKPSVVVLNPIDDERDRPVYFVRRIGDALIYIRLEDEGGYQYEGYILLPDETTWEFDYFGAGLASDDYAENDPDLIDRVAARAVPSGIRRAPTPAVSKKITAATERALRGDGSYDVERLADTDDPEWLRDETPKMVNPACRACGSDPCEDWCGEKQYGPKKTVSARMQKGKIDSLLAKSVTFEGRLMTKARMIEEMVRLGGVLKRDHFSKYVFSRSAFNRMDYAEQKKYEEKLKTKMPFAVELPSGSFFEITKTEADYFLSLGGSEEFKQNPAAPRAAISMYARFQGHEPKKLGHFYSGFKIPTTATLAGPAFNVMYRSDKNDPSTGKPVKNPIDYIHDHEDGVNVYRCDRAIGGLDTDVPAFIRDVDALVLLGDCLGFTYEDDAGAQIEASPTTPYPELYTIPSGRALLVVQGKRKVLAIIWGGRLGVEARGIVH